MTPSQGACAPVEEEFDKGEKQGGGEAKPDHAPPEPGSQGAAGDILINMRAAFGGHKFAGGGVLTGTGEVGHEVVDLEQLQEDEQRHGHAEPTHDAVRGLRLWAAKPQRHETHQAACCQAGGDAGIEEQNRQVLARPQRHEGTAAEQ